MRLGRPGALASLLLHRRSIVDPLASRAVRMIPARVPGALARPSWRIMDRYLFRLYVAGQSARSRQAIVNLRRIGEERLAGRYELVVVDVLEDPASAETARVLTTPTLVREEPTPTRRITGDLSDMARVADVLDILPDGCP